MKVRDAMIKKVATCSRDSNLEAVAATMWSEDCGALPVIDEDRRPVGMITDRDICIAAALQHRAPAEMTVKDVMSGSSPAVCRADMNIVDALKVMQQARVRRVPIVDNSGKLQGILSIGDIIVLTGSGSGDNQDMPLREVISTLKSVSGRHQAAAA